MKDVKFDFGGCSYLVSGGSRGIGQAVVEALIAAGAHVAFTYRGNEAKVKSWAASLSQGTSRCVPLLADVQDSEQVARSVEAAAAELGRLDGLVNNAGITRDGLTMSLSDEAWNNVVQTNLNGAFFMTREVLKRLIRQQGGKIVNIASVSGITGLVGQASYCASKGGLIAMTRSVALEVARFNIQVNALAPGFIDTDMVQTMPTRKREEALQRVPARRFGSVEEISHAVLYLLSDATNYMTGQTLVMDGGLTA